jgi:hypothetical protein
VHGKSRADHERPGALQLWRDADGRENQRYLWELLMTLIHEYLHLLESAEYVKWRNSLRAQTHAFNAAVEGVAHAEVMRLVDLVGLQSHSRRGAGRG